MVQAAQAVLEAEEALQAQERRVDALAAYTGRHPDGPEVDGRGVHRRGVEEDRLRELQGQWLQAQRSLQRARARSGQD